MFKFCLLIAVILAGSIADVRARISATDFEIIYDRRLAFLLAVGHNPEKANKWRKELTPEGIWNDVNYIAGCPADRSIWGATQHMERTSTMACLWNHNRTDTDLLDKIQLAFNYWLDRDFPEEDCIFAGGDSKWKCPCGTPGLWNPNWWWQMIDLPRLIGNVCLLLKPVLTPSQSVKCHDQIRRVYVRMDGDPNNSRGFRMTGANKLDVAYAGISLALISADPDLLADAVSHYYGETGLTYGTQDGIKVDGTYYQHDRQIMNGSYGAVFIRLLLQIFKETVGTSVAPAEDVQNAFLVMMNGSEFVTYTKNQEGDPRSPTLMWLYSVVGRSVSRRYERQYGIQFEPEDLQDATREFQNSEAFAEIAGRLGAGLSRKEHLGLNPGMLVGTRYFHWGELLVHRNPNNIVTLKMYSRRTTNSECHNSENPFGFHLSDGTIYTQKTGNEYTNIFGAWDWNLIPGTTIDYGATPLSCGQVQKTGIEDFVGAAVVPNAGVAVMNFTNPTNRNLHWKKSFFFFPDYYVVQFVGDIISASNAPVYTTLDQRHLLGDVFIDGQISREENVTRSATAVWHDHTGYTFLEPVTLTVDLTPKVSDWEAIGSSTGNETLPMFTIYAHYPPGSSTQGFTYIAALDVDAHSFFTPSEISPVQILPGANGQLLESKAMAVARGAAYGDAEGSGVRYVSIAFWTPGSYSTGQPDISEVEVSEAILVIFQRKADGSGWTMAVADPTQKLNQVEIVVKMRNEQPRTHRVALPSPPWAGSTTTLDIPA